MGGQFRQGKRESAKACLNGRPNQTGQAGKCQSMSEWEAKSDRASGKVPKHVRMRVKFSQGKRKVPGYSPNTKFILNGCKLIELNNLLASVIQPVILNSKVYKKIDLARNY
jgi:hypothetical protein